jgi:hypothetical protein
MSCEVLAILKEMLAGWLMDFEIMVVTLKMFRLLLN